MSIVHTLLADPGIPATERQAAIDRAYTDPGTPNAKATTKSFWLKRPHPTLANIRSPELPARADIVIVGSGITGASAAKTILESTSREDGPNHWTPTVVMLEARDICSGATARNGGHILETAQEYPEFEDEYGAEAAKKITRFKLAHLEEILRIADEFGIAKECQARKVECLTVYFDDGPWTAAVQEFQRTKKALPEELLDWKVLGAEEIPKEFCLPNACGVVAGVAGAIWPYKFVTGILARLKSQYGEKFHIETNTPVQDIIENAEEDFPFSVSTPRGTIQARHIVHCTNAHVGHLVPGLRGSIYPIRGQMSAQPPGNRFPDQSRQHSWLFMYDKGFDYLTQLPRDHTDSDGEMMMGGGVAQGKAGGVAVIGVATDDKMDLYSDIHLSGVLSAVFGRENWGHVEGSSVKQMWTGNMGFSADGLPWVGKLPREATGRGKKSADADVEMGAEWAAAAYSGEGMVSAWLCGKAVATMLLQETGTSAEKLSWFPEQLLITNERIHHSRLKRNVKDY